MTEISWRTGVNMREFAYYGTPARQHTTPALQRTQLEHLREMQVHLVRFYASCNIFAAHQCSEKVLGALNLLQEFGMQAIVCLTDSLGSEFTVQGNESFHAAVLGHLIKQYWHERAYESAFMEFARRLLDTCADHPGVFMWELGNEYAIHPQPASWGDAETFLEFARHASHAIKEAAPDALVSTGLVGTHHVAPQGEYDAYATMLYGQDTIDAISIHYYADDGERDCALREAGLAKSLDKPYYVGEFGAPHDWPDRGAFYRSQLEEWQRKGAFSALPWAFDASPSDVGVSDTKALARIHPEFDGIAATLREFARPPEPVVILTGETQPSNTPRPRRQERPIRVVDGPVNVRRAPSLFGSPVTDATLHNGQRVSVDGTSRTVADGYVWWRHQDGWSAERSTDRQTIFLLEERPRRGPRPRPANTSTTNGAKAFRVIDGPLSVRTEPSLEAATKKKGVVLRTAQRVEVDLASRTEVEGYVWWQHRDGWSAECSVDLREVFLRDDAQFLASSERLFQTWPIDFSTIQWIHYYGNTTFAFEHGAEHNYDGYSQGIHGGLDFGHPGGTTIVAGIQPGLDAICTYVGDERSFRPFRVDIQVGQYLLIYGELTRPLIRPSDRVGPDTVIAITENISNRHLHLEIRSGSRILNPLNFFPPELCEGLFQRFNPVGDFQPFDRWQSPLDQPEIKLGGPVIGPRAV